MARKDDQHGEKTGGGETKRARYWRGVMEAWSGSGKSQAAFCRERGLSLSAFHYWRREFKRREGSGSGRKRKKGARKPEEVRFVPVEVMEGENSADGGTGRRGSGVSVELEGGRVVRVEGDFEPGVLLRVVAVLEGGGC